MWNKFALSAYICDEGRRRGRGGGVEADWASLTVNTLRSAGKNLLYPFIFAMKGGGGKGGGGKADRASLTINTLRSLGTNLLYPLIFAMKRGGGKGRGES